MAFMQTIDIRERLHHFIDTIGDEKIQAIYTLLEGEIDTDEQRRKLIKAEREKYLRNEGQSYSWEDVKEMALNKNKRNGL
jgi:hypothetical protein